MSGSPQAGSSAIAVKNTQGPASPMTAITWTSSAFRSTPRNTRRADHEHGDPQHTDLDQQSFFRTRDWPPASGTKCRPPPQSVKAAEGTARRPRHHSIFSAVRKMFTPSHDRRKILPTFTRALTWAPGSPHEALHRHPLLQRGQHHPAHRRPRARRPGGRQGDHHRRRLLARRHPRPAAHARSRRWSTRSSTTKSTGARAPRCAPASPPPPATS